MEKYLIDCSICGAKFKPDVYCLGMPDGTTSNCSHYIAKTKKGQCPVCSHMQE